MDHVETRPPLRKRQIIMAFRNPLVRFYCLIRFTIIRINILEKIEKPIRAYRSGRVLDIGCGFGLFAIYNASRHRHLQFDGFDLNAGRIRLAQQTAARLGVDNVSFRVQDARQFKPPGERYKIIYMLDILHHVPVLTKYRLLKHLHGILDDDGILIIKDIDSRPLYKVAFTWLLDRLMCPTDDLTYQSHKRLAHILSRNQFTYKKEFIHDIMPYPHMCLVCRKLPADAQIPRVLEKAIG